MSFDAEFYDNDDDTFTVFSVDSDVSGGSIVFRKSSGSVQWYHNTSSGATARLVTSTQDYTIGRHTYSLVFDGSTFSMYCDGAIISSRDSDDFCWFDVDGYIRLGNSGTSTNYYNNQLKNFKVLHYAASSDEVAAWGAPKQ